MQRPKEVLQLMLNKPSRKVEEGMQEGVDVV